LLHFNIQSIYNIAKEFTNIYFELQKFGLEQEEYKLYKFNF
jgi:hypothetical protein